MTVSGAALTIDDYRRHTFNARVYDIAIETPLELAPHLTARVGAPVSLKREDLQIGFSFKARGAANKMMSLTSDELAAGVVCASAGNHAQGVALAARHLGCVATIVMPVTTPQVKIDAVIALGANIVLHGDSYSDAAALAATFGTERGLTPVHPFDDPAVIAGQGTIAAEILRQHTGDLAAVYVPVGGGGLIAGVGAFLKATRPDIAVVGVQAGDADAMRRSVLADSRVTLDEVGLFADGTAVRTVGHETLRVARQVVDEFVTVTTDELCAAIRDIHTDTRSIVEPAGALAVAGAIRHANPGDPVVAITSGANMNFSRLRFVAERSETSEALLAVTIPEQPGSFRRFAHLLGNRAVTEFNYRISDHADAHVFVGVAANSADRSHLLAELAAAGLDAVDLTGDDLARDHLRHMVGGRSTAATDELLYRFVFPERPGALAEFLDAMRSEWNISMFHYRNQGSDYGRVLVGIQVPSTDRPAFAEFLTQVGYPHRDESSNPAYRIFLR